MRIGDADDAVAFELLEFLVHDGRERPTMSANSSWDSFREIDTPSVRGMPYGSTIWSNVRAQRAQRG
jgi:hypothetical protein